MVVKPSVSHWVLQGLAMTGILEKFADPFCADGIRLRAARGRRGVKYCVEKAGYGIDQRTLLSIDQSSLYT